MQKIYHTNEPIRHNGKDFAPGDTLELSDADAAGLIAAGAIVPAREAPVTAPAPDDPATRAATRAATLAAALTQLDPDNAEQWLKDGRPKSDALAVYAGFPVSAAERDAAWEQFKTAA